MCLQNLRFVSSAVPEILGAKGGEGREEEGRRGKEREGEGTPSSPVTLPATTF